MRFARSRARRRQAGQSIVEAALVLPLVLYVLISMVDVARMTYEKLVLIGAARDGARAMAVIGDAAQAESVIQQDLVDGQLSVAGWSAGSSVSFQYQGEYVQAQVRYAHRTLVPGVGLLVGQSPISPTISLQAAALFRRRG